MMKHTDAEIQKLFEQKTVSNLAIKVGIGNRIVYEKYVSDGGVDENTLFDMASVTKVMATTQIALYALDRGQIFLEDPVSKYFSCSGEKRNITVFHLLTHTLGIGYKLLCSPGTTYGNVAEKILSIPQDIPVGSDVRYSCPGFILLGKILETVYGAGLNDLFRKLVALPVGLDDTTFLPDRKKKIVNANTDDALRGEVNDCNCRFLGGVAGNAGIFSNMKDMTRFVKYLLRHGAGVMSEKTFALATKNLTPGMSESRGLGFLYVDKKYDQTGTLFPDGSIGHCGHTGQSVFLSPSSGLYVIVLSDATKCTVEKYGSEVYHEVTDMRKRLHTAIKADLTGMLR